MGVVGANGGIACAGPFWVEVSPKSSSRLEITACSPRTSGGDYDKKRKGWIIEVFYFLFFKMIMETTTTTAATEPITM
jgi:hypothetical protein